MRILLVGDYPNDPRLGSAKVPHMLAEEFRRSGHVCDLLFAEDLGRWPNAMHPRHLAAPWLAARAIQRASRRGPYDVVEVSSGDGLAWAVWNRLSYRGPRPAFVVRSHGLEHLNYERMVDDHRHGLLHKPWYKRVYYPAVRLRQVALALRLADHAVLINKRDRDFVVTRGWLPADRISVIGHGVSAAASIATCESLAEQSRGEGLLYCGTWTGVKGVDYLVDAFTQLIDEGPRVKLTVLGGGLEPKAIFAAFPERVRTWVRVLPRAPEHEVLEHYRHHDVLVFPSTYEGFGMVVPEAMSQGLPVVATPVGCVPELVEHGRSGLVIPPRDPKALCDALRRLLGDSELRRRIGQAGQMRVRGRTWRAVAEETLATYAEALAWASS